MPHSLSYHDTSFTMVSVRAMPAPMSKIDDDLQLTKSVDTTSSSVKSRMPCMGPAAASLMAATMSSYLAGFSSLQVKSTTDTSGVGTRNAMPVSFPFRAGSTFPTAFAAPVEEGMMFCDAQRPPRVLATTGRPVHRQLGGRHRVHGRHQAFNETKLV